MRKDANFVWVGLRAQIGGNWRKRASDLTLLNLLMFLVLQPAGNNIGNTEGHQGIVVDIPRILSFLLHGKGRTTIGMQFARAKPT